MAAIKFEIDGKTYDFTSENFWEKFVIDSNGNISYKNGYENLSEAEKKEVRNAANKAKKKAKGGYLTIRRK